MKALRDDAATFVVNAAGSRGRELEVAIVYATAMAEALRESVADWEAAAERLREIKSGRAAGVN